jgi:hypothetical protein
VLFVHLLLVFGEGVEHFVDVLVDVGVVWVGQGVLSAGAASSSSASRFSLLMCYRASWMLLKRSWPFILTERNKNNNLQKQNSS